jgi:hypothetical protein
MRERQVVFAEDCSLIVIGSDHGFVYVFDRRSGNVLDKLEVSKHNWVQTITVGSDSKAFQIPINIKAK